MSLSQGNRSARRTGRGRGPLGDERGVRPPSVTIDPGKGAKGKEGNAQPGHVAVTLPSTAG